jgi:hypothetical protein
MSPVFTQCARIIELVRSVPEGQVQASQGGDPRCEHCLTHCGFEPAAVLTARKGVGDMLRMAVWQMT